jgi:hypothetical protein
MGALLNTSSVGVGANDVGDSSVGDSDEDAVGGVIAVIGGSLLAITCRGTTAPNSGSCVGSDVTYSAAMSISMSILLSRSVDSDRGFFVCLLSDDVDDISVGNIDGGVVSVTGGSLLAITCRGKAAPNVGSCVGCDIVIVKMIMIIVAWPRKRKSVEFSLSAEL